MASSSSSTGGIGFCGLLTIVFILLKLFNVTVVATWSWWWVLSPLWIGFAVGIVILAIGITIALKWGR